MYYTINGIKNGFDVWFYKSGIVRTFIEYSDDKLINYISYTEQSTIERRKFKSNRLLNMKFLSNTLVPFGGNIYDDIHYSDRATIRIYDKMTSEEFGELVDARNNISTKLNPLADHPDELKMLNKYRNMALVEYCRLRYV